MSLKWTDTLDIAIELEERYPDDEPLTINFVDLRDRVLALDNFDDDPVITSYSIHYTKLYDVLDLHLRVVERCRFTTTYHLSYVFHDCDGAFPAPDMQVRLYHDAQVGEVISCGRRRGQRHADYP